MQEQWRAITECENYEVSNRGRVRRAKPGRGATVGRVLRPWSIAGGHQVVDLSENNHCIKKLVHRLVAGAFMRPPREGEEMHHKDFDPANNHVDNLQWVSHIQNVRFSVAAGRCCTPALRGEAHGRSKLTEKEVCDIRRLNGQLGVSQYVLAERYGVTQSHISSIMNRRCWTHLPEMEP